MRFCLRTCVSRTAFILRFCTPPISEVTFAGTGMKATMTASPTKALTRKDSYILIPLRRTAHGGVPPTENNVKESHVKDNGDRDRKDCQRFSTCQSLSSIEHLQRSAKSRPRTMLSRSLVTRLLILPMRFFLPSSLFPALSSAFAKPEAFI